MKRRELDAGPVLPHNLAVEASTLGAALLRESAADFLVSRLVPGVFYRHAHRLIFEAIVALRGRAVAVDLLTLAEQLGASRLDDIGGKAYLAALVDGLPAGGNVEHYARLLDDLRTKRALVAFGDGVVAAVTAGQSSTQILVDADRDVLAMQSGYEPGHMASLSASASDLLADLEYRTQHRGELTGVDTGFQSINELTSGWQAGDVIIVAARPSIGKSSFAINTAVAAARAGTRVAFFSLEMKRQQLEYRILSGLSGISIQRLLGGFILDSEWPALNAAISLMGDLPLEIDDMSARSVWDIRVTCRRLRSEGGLGLVVVDYAQLMPGTLDRRGATRNEEMTDISRRLKILAGDLDCPLMLLSQLNRGGDARADSKPRLTDLRESGSLEQDADLVCFLHRKHHREGGTTQFVLEKQRNGSTGTVNLTLDRDLTLFTDGGDDPPAVEDVPAEKKARQSSFFRRAHAR